MKNLKWIFVGALSVGLLSGCAGTEKILDASWVSMKNSMPPSAQDKLMKVGPISEEYCMTSWSGNYGLMDEAVKQAEQKNQIDYIKYPAFTKTVGKNCVQVSGDGYRVAR